MAEQNHLMEYMVEFKLPKNLDEEFMSLIPQQRMQVGNLFSKRKMCSYTLSLNRAKAWATISAKDEWDVIEIVESLPLTFKMTYDIIPLMFNELAKPGFPAISLN